MTSSGVCAAFVSHLQVQICKRSVEVMDAVRRGAQLAIDECQFQFRNRRWNCSTLETMPVFGKVVTQGETTHRHQLLQASATRTLIYTKTRLSVNFSGRIHLQNRALNIFDITSELFTKLIYVDYSVLF